MDDRRNATGRVWKYVNVRRPSAYVEQSIDQGLQWVVFQPNDERARVLWTAVTDG